uniref:Sepiapterin reductase n=1 Tax=Globisporangium ultimum (strain ATCC 200006 / CBS 805.95 / DAOM BR144) TaxID=431595 RepID=K3WFV0_GLOUD
MRVGVLITGASRGFGRCVAVDFAQQISAGDDLDIHLWARSEADLKETERMVQDAWERTHPSHTLRTFTLTVDLGNKDDYTPKIDALLAQIKAESYARVFVVHNAGSLGHLGLTQEWSSHEMLDQYWHFNVHSVLWFNKRFLEEFGASREELQKPAEAAQPPTLSVIVNVTSLFGIQPAATFGLYCLSKGAREMHHKVIAKEQAPCPHVRVLQYSPGPMDGGMQQTIRESPGVDPAYVDKYGDMKANGELIPLATSSKVGVKLMLSGEFETGAHVDYYDVAPQQ